MLHGMGRLHHILDEDKAESLPVEEHLDAALECLVHVATFMPGVVRRSKLPMRELRRFVQRNSARESRSEGTCKATKCDCDRTMQTDTRATDV
jgi:hypothetical protein